MYRRKRLRQVLNLEKKMYRLNDLAAFFASTAIVAAFVGALVYFA